MKTTNFIPIDFESYKRKEHFLFFKSNTCSFSLSVSLIYPIFYYLKNREVHFFALMLYCISRSVNEFLEFKMDFQNGVLGYYEIIHPSYTIFHKNSETFSSLWSKYDEDFVKFNKNLQNDKTKFGENLSYEAKAINLPNLFYISSIPWINFTDFNLQIDRSNFYAPIFTLSKIKDSNILLNINVNHAVCDGYHVAKFVDFLQNFINNLKTNIYKACL